MTLPPPPPAHPGPGAGTGSPPPTARAGPRVHLESQPTTGDLILDTMATARRSGVVLLLGTYAIVFGIGNFLPDGDMASVLSIAWGVLWVSGLIMAPFVWLSARRRRDLVLGRLTVDADADGVTVTGPLSTTRLSWAVYLRARETPRAFHLSSGTSLTRISKRGASPDSVSALRALLVDRGLLRAPRWVDRVRPALWVAVGVAAAALVVGPAMIQDVQATARMEVMATATAREGSVTVQGTTDLPDNAVVILEIYQLDRWQLAAADGRQPDPATFPWFHYSSVAVHDGRFSGTYSIQGWPPGRGAVAALFWISGNQPADVVDRFGADGAGLRGPDVVDRADLGITLQVRAGFTIEGS